MAIVKAELREGTQITLRTRQFTWLADEPPISGGTDAGPEPYEILVGSLAACITLTLRIYADYKGIELRGADVTLQFDRVHADDCVDCDKRRGNRIERIQTRAIIRGTFDEAQRTRLAQVVRRCPVHKTLANGVQIFDSVSFEEATGTA